MDSKKQENIMKKARMKIAISNFVEEEKKMTKNKLWKTVATFLLTIGITTGLVYATSVAYEKIWKEPEQYTLNSKITEEEKEECISEEEAKKIGNDYLRKIGFKEEEIQGLQLEKSNIRDEIQWFMTSGFASLVIEGKTGRIVSVSIPSYNYEIPKNAGVTRQEAKKVAYELLEKYKPNDDTGEYELITLTRNANKDEDAYIWYAVFYKKYGDLLNEKESIRIGWIPTINSLYSLSFVHNVYENNEVVISKEDAIKIATEKDKQIETEKKIKNTTAELRIESMNESVYLRENNKEEYESGMLNRNQMEKVNGMYKIKEGAVFYRTEERVRKVWRVIIEYDVSETKSPLDAYTYYVDATTGEIIGGELGNPVPGEEGILEDPYNVMNK